MQSIRSRRAAPAARRRHGIANGQRAGVQSHRQNRTPCIRTGEALELTSVQARPVRVFLRPQVAASIFFCVPGHPHWTPMHRNCSDAPAAAGYVTDVAYPETFFRELSPVWLNYVATLGRVPPRDLEKP